MVAPNGTNFVIGIIEDVKDKIFVEENIQIEVEIDPKEDIRIAIIEDVA